MAGSCGVLVLARILTACLGKILWLGWKGQVVSIQAPTRGESVAVGTVLGALEEVAKVEVGNDVANADGF